MYTRYCITVKYIYHSVYTITLFIMHNLEINAISTNQILAKSRNSNFETTELMHNITAYYDSTEHVLHVKNCTHIKIYASTAQLVMEKYNTHIVDCSALPMGLYTAFLDSKHTFSFARY